jgi:propanol-preferring alcohol dehydrogenase
MKAWRLLNPAPAEERPLKLEDLPVPSPADGELLVRVLACGVCHTDLHTVEGEIHPPHLPVTPGHQVVGVIESTGSLVERFNAGDRVGVPWLYWACGECEFCQRSEENLCPKAKFTGFDVNGGYAQFMVAPESYALPLPEGISDIQAAPLLCAGIIGYRSLKRANLQPGEHLGLVGFGASAHLAIQVARYWGCTVSVFTRSQDHRQHALELGAAWAGGIEQDPPRPLDRAVIFAPSGALVPVTLQKLRPGGTLAVNAVFMSEIPSMPYERIYRERTLTSVANATYQDGVELLALATEIPLHADVNVYAFEDAPQALIDLKRSAIRGEAVLKVQ